MGRSLSWVYDDAGNVIQKTDYQDEITYYQYDSTNRLIAERNPAYLQVSYHYDPAGRLLNRILSNAARTDYAYDDDNRLVSLANVSAGDKLSQSQSYTRDRLGNILTTTDAAGTTIFTYDALYRLTAADYPGTADDKAYTYDAVGNRRTLATASATLHYLYNNAGNRLSEVRSGSDAGPLVCRYVYDDAGNRIEKRNGTGGLLQSCAYDQKNRITTLDGGGSVQVLEYDPNDYRIAKDHGTGTNRYLMEGEHYEAIYDGAGGIRAKFLRGVVVDEIVNGYYYDAQGAKTNYTFHHDHLQSVTALSGHNGDPEQTVTFGPFGEDLDSTGASPNVLGYTGRELDSESGLYYYRARYYDPEIGRFLNEDPLGLEAGINFYVYCQNNPINYNDPSGKIAPAVVAGYFLLGKATALGASWLGIQTATHGPEIVGNVASWMGFENTGQQMSEVFPEPTSFGNQVWAGALEANRVQMQVAMEMTGADIFVDTLSAATGYNPLNLQVVNGDIVLPKSDSFDRVSTGLLVFNEFKYDYFGSVVGSDAVSNTGKGFGLVEAGMSVYDAYQATDFTRAWGSSSSSGAAGGYVLYPNKPNTNMMQQVYKK